tara:strand:+ start:257 stop:901 length:645 start_codon:yes stop_codon:yes gene_type:complete
MALSKVNFNSINATPTASKFVTFNSDADGLAAGDVGGALTLISTQTASGSATLDFTSGIDSTYKEYIFKFYNMHPATNNVKWTFQSDTGTNTSYGQTITSTDFISQHSEDDSATELGYASANDQAQGTAFQPIGQLIGNGNDECVSGTLHIFDPSNATFVKHFMANTNVYRQDNYSREHFTAGYFNTTTALTRFRFKFDSGNTDSGVIKLYGVS